MERIRKHKKMVAGILALAVLIGGGAAVFLSGGTDVEFTVLSEDQYPGEIVSQVIPEYRKLERALACVVNDEIYVVATRGEKASEGYQIVIDKMTLVEENETSILEVYVKFMDPEPNTAMGQAVTYPLQVAKTELTELPDQISLKVQYVD